MRETEADLLDLMKENQELREQISSLKKNNVLEKYNE